MSSINYDLTKIKAVIFDVDGVLSPATIQIGDDGEPIRKFSVHDRYIIRDAVSRGLILGVLTAADTSPMRKFLYTLHIPHDNIYLGCKDKCATLKLFMQINGLSSQEVCYIGDDIPDYKAMLNVGLKVCPNDGTRRIKDIADYISDRNGGYGVIRDVLEQIMRAKGLCTD